MRSFNFTDLPPHARDVGSEAWKPFILAVLDKYLSRWCVTSNPFQQIYTEHDLFFFVDTSVYFLENDFEDYVNMMASRFLTGIQMPQGSNRGVLESAHKGCLLLFKGIHEYKYGFRYPIPLPTA